MTAVFDATEAPARGPAWRSVVGRVAGDSLFRNSFYLMGNSVVMAGIGAAFWVIASHVFPARSVGQAAALVAAFTLASTAANMGMPNTVIRYAAAETEPRLLIEGSCAVVIATSAVLGVLWWLIPGHLGVPITVLGHGVLLPVILVSVIAVGGVSNVADAAMIGLRESRHLLVKNTVGSIAKLIDLPLLVGLGAGGLFAATVSANVVASAIAFGVLSRVLLAPRRSIRVADMARVLITRVKFAAGAHISELIAMLPSTTLPIIVLNRLGPSQAAYAAPPLMIVALFNVIPGMTANSLLAEVAADEASLGRHLRKAFVAIYALAIPAIVVLVLAAPLILGVFGRSYAHYGTPCLRYLAVAGIFACFNYVGDAVLLARARIGWFTAVNTVGTMFALGLPVLMMSSGLRGLGQGWLLGQVGYAACTCVGLYWTRYRSAIAPDSGLPSASPGPAPVPDVRAGGREVAAARTGALEPADPSSPDLSRPLIISPHLDDAVLSGGRFLAAHPGGTVVTVFAGSPRPGVATAWDVSAGFASGADPIVARREEDARALDLLGARPVWLEFQQASYRDRGRLPAKRLAEALRAVIEREAPTVVCIPLGLEHRDHQLVHRAARRLIGDVAGVTWLAYEDQPYRQVPGVLQARLVDLLRAGLAVTPAFVGIDCRPDRKRMAIGAYVSQLAPLAEWWGTAAHPEALDAEAWWSIAPAAVLSAARAGLVPAAAALWRRRRRA